MELELGLKIIQTRDDHSSVADLRIANNGGGLVFLSRETEAMFFLTAHLRGYRRKNIDIEINEDGTRISISGTKAVQEKVIRGWVVQRNEVELRGFDKVFQIPQGMVLDKIKAKFDEEESILTISMPKSVKGISGSVIEEVSSGRIDGTQQTEQNHEEIEQPPENVSDSGTSLSQGTPGTVEKEDGSGRRKKCKINVAAVAGSALLVSALVLVVNLIRTRHK